MTRGKTQATPHRQRWPYVLYGIVLVGAVTWPFFLPGTLLWRDMAILDAPGLTAANFGGGDLPARNAPQDGLLALAGVIHAGGILARLLVICAAAAAAWAGYRCGGELGVSQKSSLGHARGGSRANSQSGRTRRPVGTCAAMLLAVINPFVVERLLQGQWSLAVAAWALPAIAVAGLVGHRHAAWLGMCAAAITPTGGIFALVTGILTVRRDGRHRGQPRGRRGGLRQAATTAMTALIGVLLCLPWVVPGLLAHPGDSRPAASVAAFAPRAEEYAGTFGTLLGLGGIWNSGAVPASRMAGFALFGFLLIPLVILGTLYLERRVLVPLGALAAVGVIAALGCWLFPELLSAALRTIPGAGLFRDSQKLMALAIPLYVAALGALERQAAWAGLLTAALLTPDAPWAVRVIAPTGEEPVDAGLVKELGGVDTFFADRGPLVRVDAARGGPWSGHDSTGGHAETGVPAVAVDPYAKATSKVESGELTVDGMQVDKPSPRWLAARDAWQRRDMQALEDLGVGAVVEGENILARTDAPPQKVPWALTVGWMLIPALISWRAMTRRGTPPATTTPATPHPTRRPRRKAEKPGATGKSRRGGPRNAGRSSPRKS